MSAILLRLLAEAAIRAAVVAVLVGAILAGLRVRSGVVRHASWTAVLGAMLLMPILARVAPAISIPLPGGILRRGSILEDIGADAGTIRLLEDRAEGSSVRRVLAAADSTPQLSPGSRSESQPGAGTKGLESPPPFWSTAWPFALLVLYGAGGLVLAFHGWLGWRGSTRIRNAAQVIAIPDAPPAGGTAGSAIPLLESAAIVTPVTVGALAPAILLPPAWRQWSGDTLRAVLAHELVHARHRHPLVGLLARVNRCLFWFHPLAWWLERALSAAAEEASDDEAVRGFDRPEAYAAILIDMARAVRDNGGRRSWQMAGITGDGLGQRIDRILRGDCRHRTSVWRRTAVAAGCAAAVVLAVACRPYADAAGGDRSASMEQRDRRLRVELRELLLKPSRDLAQVDRAARPQREVLEASVAGHPDDLAALKDLLIDEWMAPRPSRRAHILRLIERHPDSDLAGSLEARIFPKDLERSNERGGASSPMPGDAAGYEQAKALWLAHADRPGVSARVLENAAWFFEEIDNPLAEAMLQRARTRDPRGPWSLQLGRLFAVTLLGSSSPAVPKQLVFLSRGEPDSGYGAAVRRKLGESADDVLLTSAGWFLLRAPGRFRSAFDPDPVLWAEACFKRALQVNPQSVLAHTALLEIRARQRHRGEPLWRVPPAREYDTVAALPEAERFEELPALARAAYSTLEDLGRWDDPNLRDRVELARQNAARFAADALALAPKYRTHPDYGTAIYTANMTLGSLALRDGNRKQAVEFLRRASTAPASETLAYSRQIVSGLHWHLAADLLTRGERQAVIAFLDRMAAINIAGRTDLREAAAAIRRGETPRL